MSNRIASRGSWNARVPKRSITQTNWGARTHFKVHHSAGPTGQTVRAIQDYHMDSDALAQGGAIDIGYNFLINSSGEVFEGRDWLGVGAHAAHHNTSAIGVCVIGDYSNQLPSEAARESLQWLYAEANRRGGKTLAVSTHRDVNPTACPGDELDSWVKAHLGSSSGSPPPDSTRPAPGPDHAFPLPSGYYFGPRDGGNESVSGAYDRTFNGRTDNEWLKEFGEQLQRRGWNARTGGTYLTQHGNDGIYGPEYEALALAFQRDQNIGVDGLIGPQTWNAAFQNPVT